ncbi:MAG: DUF4831 family protein [Bacteroidales bacterium]|nr:DUF4831 family protein [Bacteroidales bacterium]
MKKLLLPVLFMAAFGAFAQEATKVTAGKHNDFGLAYSLPTTMLEVEVQTTKISVKAGPYYKYAEKYLGVQEIVTEDMVTWELNSISLTPYSKPNKDESYVVKFKSGNPPSFYLTTDGILWSINSEPKQMAYPQQENIQADKKNENPYYTVLSEEQLSAGSTAKMAEVAAKQIYRIRESKLNILTGDVDQLPADGESFKLIISQLEEQEAALTAMFIGTTKKEYITKKIQITPGTKDSKEILFRFSKYLGVVNSDDLGGAPIYLDYKVVENLSELTEEQKKEKEKNKNKGVAYLLPGKAKVNILSGNKSLAESEIQVAQLGSVYQFPSNIFDDKKMPAKALFNPISGGIIEVIQ